MVLNIVNCKLKIVYSAAAAAKGGLATRAAMCLVGWLVGWLVCLLRYVRCTTRNFQKTTLPTLPYLPAYLPLHTIPTIPIHPSIHIHPLPTSHSPHPSIHIPLNPAPQIPNENTHSYLPTYLPTQTLIIHTHRNIPPPLSPIQAHFPKVDIYPSSGTRVPGLPKVTFRSDM